MAPMSLPPGFRFHPTDEELVAYYLDRKISGQVIELEIIPEVDLYKCEPWDLPDKSYLPSKDMEWYFFSPRDKKYPNGSRTNRATRAGYWKATGKDRPVHSQKREVGMKKTLVYYRGRAPHGIRTNWVMHEYRLVDSIYDTVSILKDSYALCRVFKKTIAPTKGKEGDGGNSEKESLWITDEDLITDDANDSGIVHQHKQIGEGNYHEHDYSKFPSDTSSSEITQGTPIDNSLADDPHIPFMGDEANSLRHASPNTLDCSAHPIRDVNISNCTRLQQQLPYPPLALEDFPHMETIDTINAKPQPIENYMMLEDIIFYGSSSQETTAAAALSIQDYTYSYYPRFS